MINNKEYEELRRDIALLEYRVMRLTSIIGKMADNELKMANAIKELKKEDDKCLRKASLRDLENF